MGIIDNLASHVLAIEGARWLQARKSFCGFNFKVNALNEAAEAIGFTMSGDIQILLLSEVRACISDWLSVEEEED